MDTKVAHVNLCPHIHFMTAPKRCNSQNALQFSTPVQKDNGKLQSSRTNVISLLTLSECTDYWDSDKLTDCWA